MVRDIHQIVNPDKFQKIQDDIAAATGLALITVDYTGRPITKHSNCSAFCHKVRTSKYGVYCEKCDSHGGLEAAIIHKPYSYICHAGLIDIAIPIIVDDLYLGAFMAGQVRLANPPPKQAPEHILPELVGSITSMNEELRPLYDKLTTMSMEQIHAFANMLLHIGNYCVTEAKMTSLLKAQKQTGSSYGINTDSKALRYADFQPYSLRKSKQLILPALSYIRRHPSEKITLHSVADLCHISPSYFSKLFALEKLGTLSDYVNTVRIEHAKELLQDTEIPVHTIAIECGYSDSGYFIKVFKTLEKRTPMEYRNDITGRSL